MPPVEPARIRVIRPGFLTTVQDLGRVGFQRYGVSVSGAMDPLAMRIGNRLVGNPDRAAGLEVTLQGLELQFETDAVIAVTGGNLSPSLDGVAIPNWTAVAVKARARLSFAARCSGGRAYLTVAGGIDIPPVLGSRSTHIQSGTGGLQGRALAKQDLLYSGRPPSNSSRFIGQTIPPDILPMYSPAPILRVVAGPQHDLFAAAETLQALVSGHYTLTTQSDRMGYRLAGPALTHLDRADIASDATPLGAIQVPADQQPILLMADRQTTGGYPKIAVVISADIPAAAQLVPGDRLRFSFVDAKEAYKLARAQRARLDAALPPHGQSPA